MKCDSGTDMFWHC